MVLRPVASASTTPSNLKTNFSGSSATFDLLNDLRIVFSETRSVIAANVILSSGVSTMHADKSLISFTFSKYLTTISTSARNGLRLHRR